MNKVILQNFILIYFSFVSLELCLAQSQSKSQSQVSVVKNNTELEWEAVIGASGYEIQFTGLNFNKIYQAQKPEWKGNLKPGVYKFKIRTLDDRKAPGEWSEETPFSILLDPVEILKPQMNQRFISKNNTEALVDLSWKKVPFANTYEIQIQGLNNNFKTSYMSTNLSVQVKLPALNEYIVSLSAKNLQVQSSKVASLQFQIYGTQLLAPQLLKPESIFVRELKWKSTNQIKNETYTYQIQRWNLLQKKFQPFISEQTTNQTIIPFEALWPGGTYRLIVSSEAEYRIKSKQNSIVFNVRKGDRSLASEETLLLRKSIDKSRNWYLNSSYMITSVQYKNTNFDKTKSTTQFESLGGTLKLGAGILQPQSDWGFYNSFELSQLNVERLDNLNYFYLDSSLVYRIQTFRSGDFRQMLGVFYKDIPDIKINSMQTIRDRSSVSSYGLKYGIEYWSALTPKWGFHALANLHAHLLKSNTPNDQNLNESFSQIYGTYINYKYKNDLNFSFGYTYRQDNILYKSVLNSINTNQDNLNSIELSGHYLSFLLELQL